jgi:hypothetical protein
LSVLCFHATRASDDNDKNSSVKEWRSGGSFHKGKVYQHSSLLAPIIERQAVGYEIFLARQTNGKHSWEAFFNYPEYGMSYSFFDLGCPGFVGTAQSLCPYLNFNLFDCRNPVNFQLKTGTGIAYVEKIYNSETNPLNHAFSTHLNIVLNAQLRIVCKLNSTWSLSAGAEVLHLSNGAYKMPNLGLNTFNYFMGINQLFGKKNRFIPFGNHINKKNKNWDCSVFLLGGIKQINPIGGKTYFAGDFNMELSKKHLQFTRFGLSLDVTHDGSEYDCIIFQSLPEVDRLKTTRIGVSGGYAWLFGAFSVDLYFGTYLHEPNHLYGKVYQRTSLRYPLSDRVKLSLAFRNHKGKADFIGLGFGYRLTK